MTGLVSEHREYTKSVSMRLLGALLCQNSGCRKKLGDHDLVPGLRRILRIDIPKIPGHRALLRREINTLQDNPLKLSLALSTSMSNRIAQVNSSLELLTKLLR